MISTLAVDHRVVRLTPCRRPPSPFPLPPERALRARPLPALLDDLGDDAGAHRAAAFANGEPEPLIHRDRRDQRDLHLDVVPRHHHLRPLRQLHAPRHVRRPEVKLRPVPVEKRRMPPPLFLGQHVHLPHVLRVRRDAPPLPQHHPPIPRSNSPTLSPPAPHPTTSGTSPPPSPPSSCRSQTPPAPPRPPPSPPRARSAPSPPSPGP